MTVSIWNRRKPKETLQCDVAVIGAGICGLSVAIELELRGLSVIVIDRGSIGCGASTRNAGYLMRGTADSYVAAVREYGHDLARTMWRWTEENLTILRQRVTGDAIENVPSALVAQTDRELHDLVQSRQMLQDDGFDVGWVESGSDALWRSGLVRGMLVNPNDARCNSRMVVDTVASHLKGRILENAEVYDIVRTDRHMEVRAEGLHVQCSQVVHCTNAWASGSILNRHIPIEPNRAQMLAIKAPEISLDFSYYLRGGADYIRCGPDGLVLVGGCRKEHERDEQTSLDQTTGPLQSDLHRLLTRTLGLTEPDVVARWSGIMAFTPDGLPVMGPVDHERRTWVCAGFNGHGMGLAARCAQALIAEIVDGEPTPLPLSRFDHRVVV
ncbi:MAG: FAD-binding oxidoreductase [Phycisphaeraceae bacterium]|nr:FAD-binding oxidoreductase [Phycisphaerales bacterium]MCB9861681.1 FAD-binding oxidoreductase [Phycisphaeraceae bacterium]